MCDGLPVAGLDVRLLLRMVWEGRHVQALELMQLGACSKAWVCTARGL